MQNTIVVCLPKVAGVGGNYVLASFLPVYCSQKRKDEKDKNIHFQQQDDVRANEKNIKRKKERKKEKKKERKKEKKKERKKE